MLICPLFVLSVLTVLFALFALFVLSELTALFALAWRFEQKYYQTNIALAASSLAAKTTALAAQLATAAASYFDCLC
jgi:hypothetical protein